MRGVGRAVGGNTNGVVSINVVELIVFFPYTVNSLANHKKVEFTLPLVNPEIKKKLIGASLTITIMKEPTESNMEVRSV